MLFERGPVPLLAILLSTSMLSTHVAAQDGGQPSGQTRMPQSAPATAEPAAAGTPPQPETAQTSPQPGVTLPTIVVNAPASPPRTATARPQPRVDISPAQPSVATAPTATPLATAATSDAIREPVPLVGIATTGSSGVISQDRIEARLAYRPSEVLESVPGLIVSQHSGEGKANQYFLRGFNLDHGTDLAISLDGMPLNMPTHGHAQGYADANVLIPELTRSLAFRKGPYFASEGNFASAGAIHLDYVDKLEKNIGQIEFGSFGYRRALAAMSAPMGSVTTLAALEYKTLDGPWNRPDELSRLNGVLRFSEGTRDNGWAITGMGYSATWSATDQIAMRAVGEGLIGRFGTLDPTDGGETNRTSLSARWARTDGETTSRSSAFAVRSTLDLYNNFTYALYDAVNGDQFHQLDRRTILGGQASQAYAGTILGGIKTETEIGVQVRNDQIRVGLFKTKEREYLSTVRADSVSELSLGGYGQSTVRWTDWFRTIAGLRYDYLQAQVSSNLAANSGSASDMLASPKVGLVLGPWARTELYLSGGFGHHSNDARGAVSTVDPADGTTPLQKSPLLVRSKGAEVGLRSEFLPGFSATLAGFILDYDSEIVFQGDTGTTEASRPSRRIGGEATLHYKIMPGLTIDLEYASTQARFKTDDPAASGRHIPGAVEGVAKAGFSFENVRFLLNRSGASANAGGWFGGMQWRYFGPRPLIEDNSVRSKAMMPLSARLGYKFSDTLTARLDGFNILNEKTHQIDYFYASQLRGETSPVSDVHFHAVEPASVRLTVTKLF